MSKELKAAANGYFAYDDGDYCEYDTAEEARNAAEKCIDSYRDQAFDGWAEDVANVCWGVVLGRAVEVGLRETTEEDYVSPDCELICDYQLSDHPADPQPITPEALKSRGFVRNEHLGWWFKGRVCVVIEEACTEVCFKAELMPGVTNLDQLDTLLRMIEGEGE